MARPQPESFRTRAEYRWALKQWKRKHGGSLASTLLLAVIFGGLSGSTALLIVLVAFALAGTAYARRH